MRYVTDRHI